MRRDIESHQEAQRSGRACLWGEYLLLVGLVVLFLWRGFIPGWRALVTDFPNYYLGARLYRQGYSLERAYDWIWFQRQKDHAGIPQTLVSFVPMTPISIVPVLPLTWLPALKAKQVWLIINLVLLFLTGYLLSRFTSLGPRRTAILIFLAVVPLRASFILGQGHVLVLFLIALALWLYLGGWPATSGVTLAAGAALKIYPILFLFYFARKKQWRASVGLVTGSVASGLLSLWLFGLNTMRVYYLQVLPRTLRGESTAPYLILWNSSAALLHRLFIAEPMDNPHPLTHLPAAYSFLQPAVQALLFLPFLWFMQPSRGEPGREKLEWGAYVALLLIISTAPSSYHFIVLIITAVLLVDYFASQDRRTDTWLFTALYVLLCLPLMHFVSMQTSGWRVLLAIPRFYVSIALWVFLLRAMAKFSPRPVALGERSSEGTVFGLLFAMIVIVGGVGNLRHFRGQFGNYTTRLPIPDFTLAAEPAPAVDKILFTNMTFTPERYATGRVQDGSIAYTILDEDTFHPALSADASSAWVELSSKRSTIIRLPLASAASSQRPAVEVEDGEQPTVSTDGKWLAFIRETGTRGSLWVKEIRPNRTEGPAPGEERELVNATYDVWDAAFFPDRRIAFSAAPDGARRIFVVDLNSGRIAPLTGRDRRARYPAISLDGQWLAYSGQVGANWELQIMNLQTGDNHPLTDADCNSISPAWLPDGKTLVYATDCGRGLGLTALCRIRAVP